VELGKISLPDKLKNVLTAEDHSNMSWVKVNGYTANTLNGGCLLCGNGDVRETANGLEPILSTGFETFEGTPEICATCIGEAATMIGFVSGVTHAKEVEARKVAQAENLALQTQLDDKAATVRTLTAELVGALNEASAAQPAVRAVVRTKAKASA